MLQENTGKQEEGNDWKMCSGIVFLLVVDCPIFLHLPFSFDYFLDDDTH